MDNLYLTEAQLGLIKKKKGEFYLGHKVTTRHSLFQNGWLECQTTCMTSSFTKFLFFSKIFWNLKS